MSEVVNCFRIFHHLPFHIFEEIKTFYVSQHISNWGKIGYCVTKDDQVYVVGENIARLFAYNENSHSKNYTIISELCNKQIEVFFGGHNFWLALNPKNEVYCWGSNSSSLLFNDAFIKDNVIQAWKDHESKFLPRQICFNTYFNRLHIIDISCGTFHCLLWGKDSSDNNILCGWGDNEKGQLGQLQDIKYISSIELNDNIRNQIKSIYCTDDYSFVVTLNSDIYKLTCNGCHLFLAKDILKNMIMPSENHYHANINEIPNEEIDIHISQTHIIYEVQSSVYEYYFHSNDQVVNKTDYINLFEYNLFKCQLTKNTIHLKDNQLYAIIHRSRVGLENYRPIYVKNQDYLKRFPMNKNIPSLKNFRVFNDLPIHLENDVKYCYYFSGEWSSLDFFAFFVVCKKDEENKPRYNTYVIGNNSSGKLGLGSRTSADMHTLIEELHDQNIEEFYEGKYCMFARNDKNQILGWGRNDFGQLGIGSVNENQDFVRPQMIEYFEMSNIKIIDISCGDNHCLALSPSGHLYGWGHNNWGQTGSSKQETSLTIPEQINVFIPEELSKLFKFKFIHCYNNSSYAITSDGRLYYWGIHQLTHSIISEIKELEKVQNLEIKKFVRNKYYCFIQTKYEFYKIKFTDCSITTPCDENVLDMYIKNDILALQAMDCKKQNCVYELDTDFISGTDFSKKTYYLNFYDYYLYKFNILFKTIHINARKSILSKEVQFRERSRKDCSSPILEVEDIVVFNKRYETLFEPIKKIAEEGFGEVHKVKNKLNNQHFVIKLFYKEDDLKYALREIKIMSGLKRYDLVVPIINSWIEESKIYGNIRTSIFIQMEFYSQDLDNFIKKSMDDIIDPKFRTFRYFISCELLRELTECVHYLHSLTPPIIHRDIKPKNVLISDPINGFFLKLCDFNMSKIYHKGSKQTKGAGSPYRTPPEVDITNDYDPMADIYCLALTTTEIFQFGDSVEIIRNLDNLDKYSNKYLDTKFDNKFKNLLKVLENCLLKDFTQRPKSIELKKRMNEWTINSDTVQKDHNIINFETDHLNKTHNFLLKKFFKSKLAKEVI